ncbi:hypothetical protein [Sphingopyxis witflariensis]|uniref:Uncharacterized protein n=1 Tax=Sphingopyxis witflariensis TaxID=173675 RepID=A0A246K039_9SPHN|nr:hypothetical protein [Sphingopyxis witflariensis]OWQ98249.1 hypothetical protein CDQ91_06955 [Sphingopyxis witflariensis]
MTHPQTPASLSSGEKAWHAVEDDISTAVHPSVPDADPYGPDSPDYAARTREQVMELPGGLVRVDYGARV